MTTESTGEPRPSKSASDQKSDDNEDDAREYQARATEGLVRLLCNATKTLLHYMLV